MKFGNLGKDEIEFILGGLWVSLKFTAISVMGGLFMGTLLTFLRFSKIRILEFVSAAYVSVFRGVPLIVQLCLIYFGSTLMFGWRLSTFVAGVMVFSLNSGAYVAEIFRAGIQAVPKGQYEAAMSLGISYGRRMKDIILPQAIRNILPSLVNEFINLFKESAIVSIIGEADLMRRSQMVAAHKFTYFEPFIIAGLCYYVVVLIFSYAGRTLEKRFRSR
ncbi:MAG: amino acid ABC transporter permease [Candidatus Paracaedibacteraceae bacterium]|nr:amino acid ABC transporter permease [Candidatus Paracaedibacteraceae bacterium]